MNVTIFGLGRIGLPIALESADSGYRVFGLDMNKRLVSELKSGIVPFQEPGLEELLKKHVRKNFFPMLPDEGIGKVKESEYILICVGTQFTRYPEKPTLDRLFRIVEDIVAQGIKDKTIILRVTLPIGTLDKVKRRMEEKSGLKEGYNFWLGFVPERLMEGKAIEEEKNLPKIIGTYSDESFRHISSFFDKVGGELIRVSNPKTAEFIKLIDNSWRNTKFAFANELAYLAERNGIDVMEAIQSANRGYKRNQIPIPGPVSGYCLGKDPYLLELGFESVEKERGFNSVWYYGRRANDWMLEKVANEVRGKKILIAGLTFKGDIDDFRYSFGIYLAEELVKRGYEVFVHDPFMGKNYYTTLPDNLDVKICNDVLSCAREVDTLIFATNHSQYYELNIHLLDSSLEKELLILDLWNIFYKKDEGLKRIKYLGFGVR